MARNEFVPGGAEVGQALRDAAAALGQGETVVKEVSGGFEAPKAVVDYYAKITVTPKEGEAPVEPEVEPPVVDNTLPGPGSAGGEHPDNTLPEPEPQPEEPDPNAPHPDNTLPGPGSAGGEHPDNTLPEPEQPVDPDSLPHPDNTLPGPGSAGGEHPDNTLPEPENPPVPDQTLPEPENPPVPDNTLPGPGSAGGEHPDNTLPGGEPHPDQTLPEPEPQPEPEPEPGNPLEPPIGRPDDSWTVEQLKAWAAENGIELATGLRKDDILVVINQSQG